MRSPAPRPADALATAEARAAKLEVELEAAWAQLAHLQVERDGLAVELRDANRMLEDTQVRRPPGWLAGFRPRRGVALAGSA